jgi:hypothetical protein
MDSIAMKEPPQHTEPMFLFASSLQNLEPRTKETHSRAKTKGTQRQSHARRKCSFLPFSRSLVFAIIFEIALNLSGSILTRCFHPSQLHEA